jgi:hypothetical protein
MRIGLLAVLALVVGCSAAVAQDEGAEQAPDPWTGCWSRVYDAVHLSKHPEQKVAAMTLAIVARDGASGDAPGNYLAKVKVLLRDKPESYANQDGARCVASGDKLFCFTDGFFLGKFSVERAGKNMKLAIGAADEHLALVPGVDLAGFIVLSPANPEHTLFLLNPAPAKSCAK